MFITLFIASFTCIFVMSAVVIASDICKSVSLQYNSNVVRNIHD